MGLGDFLGPIGSVVGGILDMGSQEAANKANAANVQSQIDFQREQSSTQYQRAVDDMRKAGLNPALAYQQGGNVASTGAAATAQPTMQNTASKFATAIDSYNQLANGAAQRDLLRAQATATDAGAALTRMQTAAARPEALYGQMFGNGSDAYSQSYFKAKMAKLAPDTFTADKTPEQYRATLANTGAGTAAAQAAARASDAAANESRTRATLNEQGFTNAAFRKNILPYINSTAKTVGIFSDIKNLANPMATKYEQNYYGDNYRTYYPTKP